MKTLALLENLAPDTVTLHISDGVNGRPDELLVVRTGDAITVFRNYCPHQGLPLNAEPNRFFMKRGNLMCAHHGAIFDTQSGECTWGPCKGEKLIQLQATVEGGAVTVDL
jgi:nitrite reductase/ring-hydroxylating ferredoxin subunit